MFNLLALVCFELARLSLFLGLLAYFTLVWFAGLEGLFCFCLLALLCFDSLCFALLCFALPALLWLLGLRCFAIICDA